MARSIQKEDVNRLACDEHKQDPGALREPRGGCLDSGTCFDKCPMGSLESKPAESWLSGDASETEEEASKAGAVGGAGANSAKTHAPALHPNRYLSGHGRICTENDLGRNKLRLL